MGLTKENPRYNVISCRVSDDMRQRISHALGNCTVQEYMHAALEEKLISDRQSSMDDYLKGLGVTEL